MKALVYDGPRQVSVKDVPDAGIERPARKNSALPVTCRRSRKPIASTNAP